MQRTPDGNLRVVGRINDQINRGGEKIASEEIEKLILLHPEVMHAALVAIVDEQFGEKSCAFIVSRNPGLKAVVLRRHLMELYCTIQTSRSDQINRKFATDCSR